MKIVDIRKDLINYVKPQGKLVVAKRTSFLQMSQEGEEAETDYLVRLGEAAQYCQFVDLKASPDAEAEFIRLQLIFGDSESNIKLLEVIKANDNLIMKELLQLIHYRTQVKKFAELSVH